MTVRNFDYLFKPRSIALIGASKRERSVGNVVARNLFKGGFDGPVLPVHPEHEAIEGVLSYRRVADLPLAPDLAIICTPPETVPGLVAELAARGTRAAVVITAGLGEGESPRGRELRQAMLDAARPHLLRIVGPNCVGILLPGLRLNASFSHIAALPGDLAFVTQSGAMVTAMLDWATPRGIGFSQVVSLGGMADVDFGDMLDYLTLDPETRAVLLYVEAVTDARKFMSAARAAARAKPVIVIKGGRHAEGAKAAASHTGALAGADSVYEAAFRRAGMLRVFSLEELFDAAQTLATSIALPSGASDRLAILTNGGGLGVLATDALIEGGGRLAELSAETTARLGSSLPATWSRGNPVDIVGDAPGSRYAAALEALLEDRGVDAVLVLNCPTAVADPTEAARAVVETLDSAGQRRRRPVFVAWLGGQAPLEARRLFAQRRIAQYDTPERATRAFMHLVRYRRGQEELLETPPSAPGEVPPDRMRAAELLEAAQKAGQEWLSESDAKALLAAYGLPVVATRRVADVEAAAAAAREIGYPVVLKIASPDIQHKSDVGGVALDLEDEAALRAAAATMLRKVSERAPAARLEGFTLQNMCRRPKAQELILGLTEDRQFGPVILFGQGGTAVEVVADKAVGLPPLNLALAHALMRRTRVFRLLAGYRDRPAADLEAVALALVQLAQLAAEQPAVLELDINPLLADAEGVVALDARVRIKPASALLAATPPAARLAIRPYPSELESQGRLRDGSPVLLRPIRPEDEPALREAFKHLTSEDIRLRFFASLSELTHELASRLTQIDYEREMALVALDPADRRSIWGVVRIAADPEGHRAEYAVVVRSDLKGRGLGYLLMERILDYARSRGIREVWGDVLAENRRMLEMCRELGFSQEASTDDPSLVHVARRLAPEPQATG